MSDVVHVDRLELAFAPKDWAFANERRAEIDGHFAEQQMRIPALFNGRVLVMHTHELSGGVFRGAYLETDFASFLAWRDWGYPDRSMRNCFAPAGLRGSDGGFVLGVMSEGTANAGRVYFPAGTPDLSDVVGDIVDLGVSVTRELHEETGLSASEFEADPGWYVVPHGPRFAMMKMMQSRETAARLRERILDNIAAQDEPELSDVVIVRGPDDLDARMMEYVAPFLHHIWRG
jgi:8-oxo-dGTP pyrophosphatase MutT (NUDIX family)